MANWKYVEKHGNPPREGQYWVTILYAGHSYSKEKGMYLTGEKFAKVTQRTLADITENKELKGWKMDDQPDQGLVWLSDNDSVIGEHVWAWLPHEEVPIADLPEGYKVANE